MLSQVTCPSREMGPEAQDLAEDMRLGVRRARGRARAICRGIDRLTISRRSVKRGAVDQAPVDLAAWLWRLPGDDDLPYLHVTTRLQPREIGSCRHFSMPVVATVPRARRH